MSSVDKIQFKDPRKKDSGERKKWTEKETEIGRVRER